MRERAYSVLLVSSSDKFNKVFRELLSDPVYSKVRQVSSVSQAKRELTEKDYDMIIVNSPVKDDPGAHLAIDAASGERSAVLFAAGEGFFEDYEDKLITHGVFMLKKPTTLQMLETTLLWMQTVRERIRRTEKKASSVEQKMEEIRLVNRAKWILISDQGMDEAQAHRLIEKRAMDRSITKRQAAEEIIMQKK